jgi:formate-nitrite transporter family protein
MAKLAIPVSAHDHAQGPAAAPLTLVEYGDFQCPHCALAHPWVTQIARELPDSLRIVFRHFPLTQVHPLAQRAAEAAEAAAAQGHFWEMVALIYRNQDELDDDSLVRYARKANLDTKRFRKELDAGIHAPRVRADFLGGVRGGVKGTPTFFINGERYEGVFNLDALVAALLKVSRGGSAVASAKGASQDPRNLP